jgi:hypothetical protein
MIILNETKILKFNLFLWEKRERENYKPALKSPAKLRKIFKTYC